MNLVLWVEFRCEENDNLIQLCLDYTVCSWWSQVVSSWFNGYNNVWYLYDKCYWEHKSYDHLL